MDNSKHTPRSLASRLAYNQLLVFLQADDLVTVSRNTGGNLNPDHRQTMTVREALGFGAWGTSQGTMTASVTHEGDSVKLLGNRAYKIRNTGEVAAWEVQAAEPRETVTCWTYET